MKNIWGVKFLTLIIYVFAAFSQLYGQTESNTPIKSREVSDVDGIPVLIKHLPDWENARNRATYILNRTDLQNALGNRPGLDLIEFESGTEAVTAPYDSGKLLLVEFSNPQSSVDADAKIQQKLSENAQNPPVFYRRIGNYNVFFFDSIDENKANSLFDQIKYEKNVQWLGEDPFYIKKAERAMAGMWSDVFIATTLWITGGLVGAIIIGIAIGFLYFRWREKQRAVMKEFSDAGGMIRLNLDGFTPSTDRLLKD